MPDKVGLLDYRGKQAVPRFFMLGAAVTAVFAASLGPFILTGQLQQVNDAPCSLLTHMYRLAVLHAIQSILDVHSSQLSAHACLEPAHLGYIYESGARAGTEPLVPL